ncbi:hypothetical protein M9Y10_002443 [Tritrichomonas musculus]|uniref:Armadillo repeat-containing domain-containing protein n=1 Tax=Tritrichomonas musculus TaxID=1915356 RepID=A0ABR2L9U3_9EUKA
MDYYKIPDISSNSRTATFYDDDDQITKSSLSYLKEDDSQSIDNQIKCIYESWNKQDFEKLYKKLCFFSDRICHIDAKYIPDSITQFMEILFTIISFFSNENTCEDDQIILDVCFKILTNISFHSTLIPLIPQSMFDFCTSIFSKFSLLPNDDITLPSYSDCVIKILLNLTSCNDSCQGVKIRLTLDQIQRFYFNNCIDTSLKANCLEIFFNILKFSDIESNDFPISSVSNFVLNSINLIQNKREVEFLLKTFTLLVQNDSMSHILMTNQVFSIFINNCLQKPFLNKYLFNKKEITQIQIITLKIISMILNVDNYQFTFNVQAVVDLANDQNDLNLILTAFETLANFADSPEHVDLLLDCEALKIIYMRMEMGLIEMKEASTKVLANIFFYLSNKAIDAMVESDGVKWLTDKLFEIEEPNIIYVSLKGLYNFFTKIEGFSFKYNFDKIFNTSGLYDCLNHLQFQSDDQNVRDATLSLIEFFKNHFKNNPNNE